MLQSFDARGSWPLASAPWFRLGSSVTLVSLVLVVLPLNDIQPYDMSAGARVRVCVHTHKHEYKLFVDNVFMKVKNTPMHDIFNIPS